MAATYFLPAGSEPKYIKIPDGFLAESLFFFVNIVFFSYGAMVFERRSLRKPGPCGISHFSNQ